MSGECMFLISSSNSVQKLRYGPLTLNIKRALQVIKSLKPDNIDKFGKCL